MVTLLDMISFSVDTSFEETCVEFNELRVATFSDKRLLNRLVTNTAFVENVC